MKNSVMSTTDSLTRQQFSMIMSSLLQSLQNACSFTVFPSVRIAVLDHHCGLPTVPIQRLPQCNRLLVCCANSKTLQLLVMR